MVAIAFVNQQIFKPAAALGYHESFTMAQEDPLSMKALLQQL
jgi:hypothetical protein